MTFAVRRCASPQEVIDAVVAEVLAADLSRGIALTGGRVGTLVSRALLEELASEPTSAATSKSGTSAPVRLWFSDERYLASGDVDRNDTALRELAPSATGVLIESALGPDACESAEASAADYATRLRTAGVPKVAVVSIGPDGHVASLFPGHHLLKESAAGVRAIIDSPKPPPVRITWTLPLLLQCETLLLLAVGDDKHKVVERILTGDSTLPATHLLGQRSTLFTA